MKGFVKKVAITAVATAAIAILLWPSTAAAQDARTGFMQRQRQIEQDLQFGTATGEPTKQLVSFDWGGWFTSNVVRITGASCRT